MLAQAVVGIRRQQQKRVVLREGAHDVVVGRWRRTESRFLRIHVQVARELLEGATFNQLLEMPIDRRRPGGQIGADRPVPVSDAA